jgi:hypothetical protein
MRLSLLALALGLAAGANAHAQVTNCKQFDNKTWCNGVLVHRFGHTIVVPDPPRVAPRYSAPLSYGGHYSQRYGQQQGLLDNSDLPTLAVPYGPSGTQSRSSDYGRPFATPPAPIQGQMPMARPDGSRVCHQFGNVLVCN